MLKKSSLKWLLLPVLASLVLTLCTDASWAQEDGKYLLRHVFLPAMSATNEIVIHMSGTMKLEKGAPVPYEANIEIRMPVKVEELKEDESGVLKIRVAEFKTEQTVGSESQKMLVRPGYMTVDDDVVWDRRNTPGPHPLAELFGSRVNVTITPRGQVKDFSSLEGLSEMLPNVDMSSQIAHGAIVFPEEAIEIGQSWQEKGKTVLMEKGKPIDSLSKYTFQKIETDPQTGDPIAIISVKRMAEAENVLMEYEPKDKPPSGMDTVDVQRLKLNKMKQNFSGTIRFDIDKGRVIETKQNGKHYIDSTADLAYGEEEMRQNTVADLTIEIHTIMTYEAE